MAMNFNRGEGMAVCCLFQISREGYKMAMKKGDKDPEKRGEYDLTNLSYANEPSVVLTLLLPLGLTKIWRKNLWSSSNA